MTHRSGSRQRFTAQQRSELLDELERRQGTVSDFAAQHGIGASTLFNWLRRRRRTAVRAAGKASSTDSSFQQVSLAQMLGPGGQWAGEVQLPDGTRLRWSSQTAPALLHEVLAHLRQSC